jgi:MoxR-like ATPase
VTLSEKDGEFVRCHPDFRVFACMNPTEGYVGTKEINPALLSRFGMVLRIDYYTPTEEAEILRYHYPSISPAISAIIVDSGNVIRKIRRSNKINYVCGTRDLISWAGIACTNNSAQLGETMTVSILNKVDPSEAMIIVEAVRNVLPSGVKWSNKVKSYDSILTKKILRDAEKLMKEKEVVCHDLETTIVKLSESLRAIRTVDEKV